MPHFTHKALRLAYDDSAATPSRLEPPAEQPVVVLLHGWGNGRSTMEPLARALGCGYRRIALDLPGHGDSGSPPPGRALEHLSVAAVAGTVEALLDHVGVGGAVLVGHSSGAAAAVEFAATRPQRTRAVVALDGPLLLTPQAAGDAESLVAHLRSPAWRDIARAHLRTSYLRTDDPALLAAELDQLARLSQEVHLAVASAVLAWDEEAALRALGARHLPMLYVDARCVARLARLARLVPQLRVEQIIGLGRMQLVGQPRLAVEAMTDFFDEVLPGR